MCRRRSPPSRGPLCSAALILKAVLSGRVGGPGGSPLGGSLARPPPAWRVGRPTKACFCNRGLRRYLQGGGVMVTTGLEIVSAEACKAAADALGITYSKNSMDGQWTHTPPGCIVHKRCTQGCRLHFGTGNGNNNGNFTAIRNWVGLDPAYCSPLPRELVRGSYGPPTRVSSWEVWYLSIF